MNISEKIRLFEAMLYIEKQLENQCNSDSVRNKRFYECEGAFHMLEALGIQKEYISWSIGK